jgi:urea transporter
MVLFGGTILLAYILDWLSTFQVTEGVFEIQLNMGIMPPFAFTLLGVIFYVALQTSLHVENDDMGWPALRHVYRTVTSK